MIVESTAALAAGLSLVMPAPFVAVASDGPWVAFAQGRSAYDCDRVSVWNTYERYRSKPYRPKVVRMGRKTSCTPGSRIVAVSELDKRVAWLHGDGRGTWTLWTATTTSPSPKLLARASRAPTGQPPIVLGPGNKDRRQLVYGEGDMLPYAVGRRVTVLNSAGRRVLTWTAPADVTALASGAGVLVVAVDDGTVFLWNYTPGGGWQQETSYSGSVAATHVAWDGSSIFAQRGRQLDHLGTEKGDCSGAQTLRSGERLVGADGGRIMLAAGKAFRVLPVCRGRLPVVSGTARAFALDYVRLTTAMGRRVTSQLLPEP